jgi:nitrite reductase/ring-hydroxylating ferredoxin subunit
MEAAPVLLCREDELAEGESRGFDPWNEGHDTVLLVRYGGSVHGWRDACPHHGGTPMAWRKDAYLNADRTRIVCAAHGAEFDIETGVCTLGPCLGQRLQPLTLVVSATRDIHISLKGDKETEHGSASSE